MASDDFELALKQHTEDEVLRYEDLKKDIRDLQVAVESLIEVWNQARGAIGLIKWMIGIAGSVTAFFLFIKDHIK